MSVEVFTRAETAQMLKVSLRTLDRWARDGALRFIKLGHSPKAPIRFRVEDIEEFLESHTSISKRDVRALMGKQ